MARKLIVTENVSLDGVIDGAGGWFLPSGEERDEDIADLRRVEREQRSAADAVLLGRVTFEEFRGYWKHRADDPSGIGAYLAGVTKLVVSRTLADDDLDWEGSTVLRGEVAEEVEALKAADGGDIVATGSITLVHALQDLDLVDEYRLFVHPVVVGAGRRLFDGPGDRWSLLEARSFPTGAALLRYGRGA